jgi:hypothetical protein
MQAQVRLPRRPTPPLGSCLDKDRACTRKVLYYGLKRAEESAVEHNKKKNDYVRPYKCRFGDHYHLGHWKGDRKKGMAS